ncbi:MAG: hypothetical protein LBG62_04065 [Candidatus Methanoplasma sp.]|jgi:hypothetical protein|nr:hypothetical protein [Candidatus Methanoplasma sp.]
MDNWEVIVDFFSNGPIPKSEYVWMVFVIGLGVFALWKSRKMVSDL